MGDLVTSLCLIARSGYDNTVILIVGYWSAAIGDAPRGGRDFIQQEGVLHKHTAAETTDGPMARGHEL